MRSECILSSSINLLHFQNSHHVHSQQHPECRMHLFALFLNPQLCELVGQDWMEEGSCSRHGSSEKAQRSLILYTGLVFTQWTANSAAGSFHTSGMKSLPLSDKLRAAESHLAYDYIFVSAFCFFSVSAAFHSVSGLKKHALQSEQFP